MATWNFGKRACSMAHTMGDLLIDICAELGLTTLNNGTFTREANGIKSSPDVT